jgi:hypothetical protein
MDTDTNASAAPGTLRAVVRPSGLEQVAAIIARQLQDGPRCSCCGRRIIVASQDDLADPTQCDAEVGPNATLTGPKQPEKGSP